jgi:hypothetical protein
LANSPKRNGSKELAYGSELTQSDPLLNLNSTRRLDTTDKFSVAIHDVQAILLTKPGRSDSSIAKSTKKKETGPYNKETLHQYERDPSSHYRKFYLFLFDLLRPEFVSLELITQAIEC